MKTQHTPGPWIMQGSVTVLHPVSGASMTTQRIETSLGFIELLDLTNEPEQNARLIAAAPELYNALRAMLAADDIAKDTLMSTDYQNDMRSIARTQAMDAARKAKGGMI